MVKVIELESGLRFEPEEKDLELGKKRNYKAMLERSKRFVELHKEEDYDTQEAFMKAWEDFNG